MSRDEPLFLSLSHSLSLTLFQCSQTKKITLVGGLGCAHDVVFHIRLFSVFLTLLFLVVAMVMVVAVFFLDCCLWFRLCISLWLAGVKEQHEKKHCKQLEA